MSLNCYDNEIALEEEKEKEPKPNSSIELLFNSHYAFGIKDRKIQVIKSNSDKLKKGDIIKNNDQLTQIISYLLLCFSHPVQLPTMDEVIKKEINSEVKKLIQRFSNDMP